MKLLKDLCFLSHTLGDFYPLFGWTLMDAPDNSYLDFFDSYLQLLHPWMEQYVQQRVVASAAMRIEMHLELI